MINAEALELADLLRPTWPEMQRKLEESGVPLNDEPTPDPAPTPDPDPKPDPDPTPSPDPDSTPDPEPEPDTVTLPKSEAERLRRENREAKEAQRDRERKEAEDAGEHQKVVQQVEQERDEKDTRISELEGELTGLENGAAIRTVASSLKFHDAEDAVLRVPDEVAEKGEAAITKFLRDLATKSPHLIRTGSPRNAPSLDPDNGGGGGEQLSSTEGMSPEQIVKAQEEGRLDDYLKTK